MNVNGVWCVSDAKFCEFLVNLPNFVDEDSNNNNSFGLENGPIITKETNSGDKDFGSLNPSNGLVRYQFLNGVIKAACKKYKVIPKSSIS